MEKSVWCYQNLIGNLPGGLWESNRKSIDCYQISIEKMLTWI